MFFFMSHVQVDGMPIRTGSQCEPVVLGITYEYQDKNNSEMRVNGSSKQIQHSFPKVGCDFCKIMAWPGSTNNILDEPIVH